MTSQEQAHTQETLEMYRELIEREGKTVKDFLLKMFGEGGKKFVLIGEYHTEIDAMQKAVQEAIPFLSSVGVTQLLIEKPSDLQPVVDMLDLNLTESEAIEYFKKNKLFGTYVSEENLKTIYLARKFGLKVVFIDTPNDVRKKYVSHTISKKQRSNLSLARQDELSRKEACEENERDEYMEQVIMRHITDKDKCLMIIGDGHIHKKPVSKLGYNDPVWITRIGTLLSNKFGDAVSSVRYAFSNLSVDGLYTSNKPNPREIYNTGNARTTPKGVKILSDKGLVKGDTRVTCSDFVMIPTF